MAKTRSQLPHLYYPPNMQQTRIINPYRFGGGFTLGWETPVDVSTVGDSIISTDGTLIAAVNTGEATNRTVNGVTFTGSTSLTGFLTFATADLYVSGTIGAAFEAMMDCLLYKNSAPTASGTLTLTGLTSGKTYLFQLLLADERGAVSTRNQYCEIQTYTSDTKLHGQTPSFICRFVASGSTQAVNLVSNDTVALNGYQVRQLD